MRFACVSSGREERADDGLGGMTWEACEVALASTPPANRHGPTCCAHGHSSTTSPSTLLNPRAHLHLHLHLPHAARIDPPPTHDNTSNLRPRPPTSLSCERPAQRQALAASSASLSPSDAGPARRSHANSIPRRYNTKSNRSDPKQQTSAPAPADLPLCEA